jgi:flagellar basal body L-ring protein FlgH
MKSLVALITAAFAVTAFAQAPAKKEEAKPAASAPAKDAKAAPAAPAKKEEKKDAAKK